MRLGPNPLGPRPGHDRHRLNGYEYTPQRTRRYRSSIPYYVYELALCVRADDPSTRDLVKPAARRRNGRRKRIGVLAGSAADRYVTAQFAKTCEIARLKESSRRFCLVNSGQLDATVQDLPALSFTSVTLKRYPRLKVVDRPVRARLLRRLRPPGRRVR